MTATPDDLIASLEATLAKLNPLTAAATAGEWTEAEDWYDAPLHGVVAATLGARDETSDWIFATSVEQDSKPTIERANAALIVALRNTWPRTATDIAALIQRVRNLTNDFDDVCDERAEAWAERDAAIARADDLQVTLAQNEDAYVQLRERADAAEKDIEALRARLAKIIPLCDESDRVHGWDPIIRDIRVLATPTDGTPAAARTEEGT